MREDMLDGVRVKRALQIFFWLAAGVFFVARAGAAPAAEQPNILFIFADDWGWGDLGCHGHSYVKTPNIDRLAREGTDFHRFTVASGVCSPSRTAVMTGQFPARWNIDGHFAWVEQNARRNMPDWLDPTAPLLPRMLRQAGYATAHYGKWHLANDMIPDSPLPSEYGYDDYGAFNCAGEQMPVHDDADRTIGFIEQAKNNGKPFFVNLWMHEPHTPFHVVPKYRWWFREAGLSEEDEIYAATLAHADDRIGQVLAAIDRLGLAENTLVIFSSDNGPARAARPTELNLAYDTATGAGFGIAASKGVTGGRRGYKAALFEGGIGVPFIARWPGRIAAGAIDDQTLLSAVDLLPTFCELAGVSLPKGYKADGVSQTRALFGQPCPTRAKPLFWKADAPWPAPKDRPEHWGGWAVVADHWKLIASRDRKHTVLFDLAADPLEQTDCTKEHPEVVRSMQGLLDEWSKRLPATPTGPVFSELRQTLDGNSVQ
jgi:N-acetylgalactosamine-6-sulfatase